MRTVAYQAGGAGNYIVIDGAGEKRDYVYMHLQTGSTRVSEGQRVRTGEWIANVGNTGASFGAHLHFEIWQGPWYAGGEPIDPLPVAAPLGPLVLVDARYSISSSRLPLRPSVEASADGSRSPSGPVKRLPPSALQPAARTRASSALASCSASAAADERALLALGVDQLARRDLGRRAAASFATTSAPFATPTA